MRYCFEMLGTSFIAEFDYTVTAKAIPESGPSYVSGGEPAEPMQWAVEDLTLFEVPGRLERFPNGEVDWNKTRRGLKPINLSDEWLRDFIKEAILNDPDINDEVEADYAEYGDY